MARSKTFDAFVRELSANKCDYVIARSERRKVSIWSWFRSLLGRRTFIWANFGAWEDYNFYGSLNPRNKAILYEESLSFQRYSTEVGRDDEIRNALNIRCLITAWNRLDRIAERIPGIDCYLVRTHDCGPAGFYVPINVGMDAPTKQLLFKEAAELKLEAFPLENDDGRPTMPGGRRKRYKIVSNGNIFRIKYSFLRRGRSADS